MKKLILLVAVSFLAATVAIAQSQKWSDLSKEEKITKAKAFRADNQNYLKNTLGLTSQQATDVDNVNLCFLSTLDRISRYGKDDASKEKYAEAAIAARSAQLDAIMGPEKHKQFSDYVKGKLEKAMANNK